MIYLSGFTLSDKVVKNPNIYPYNVFCGKYIEPLIIDVAKWSELETVRYFYDFFKEKW